MGTARTGIAGCWNSNSGFSFWWILMDPPNLKSVQKNTMVQLGQQVEL
jgi:hypothetical protein